ncbi:MAG: hypothetical protein KIT84_41675 [Labilithrix sp.]|nr:hypothetical protein [Labilithrix sp.]MCW5817583.1 hypothetical protein [Labilithrix sp.]
MKRLLYRGLAPLAVTILSASDASAQSRGYAITPLDPSSPGSDWYTTESLDLRGKLRPQVGLLVDWSYAPLVAEEGGLPRRVITDRIDVHGRASVVVRSRVRLGVSSPLTIYQHGDRGATAPDRGQAPGDLRLDADVRLAGTYGDALRCAGGLALFAPLGRRELFTSDGTFRIAPRILLAGDAKALAWAVKLAYHVRPFDGVWEGRALGDQIAAAFSAGVKVNDRFVMGPELHGAATVSGPDALTARAIPIEAMMGGRVRLGDDFQLGSAIGGRITDGDGGAKMRVLAVLEYAPDVCVDKDGDGICAYEDACPLLDGPRTHDRRTNGCPPPLPPPLTD